MKVGFCFLPSLPSSVGIPPARGDKVRLPLAGNCHSWFNSNAFVFWNKFHFALWCLVLLFCFVFLLSSAEWNNCFGKGVWHSMPFRCVWKSSCTDTEPDCNVCREWRWPVCPGAWAIAGVLWEKHPAWQHFSLPCWKWERGRISGLFYCLTSCFCMCEYSTIPVLW